MGPICGPETTVLYNHSTLLNSPKQRRSHLHGGGSLKSRMQLSSKEKSKEVWLFKNFSVSYRILRGITIFINAPFCSSSHPHRESNVVLQIILSATHIHHSSNFLFTVFNHKFFVPFLPIPHVLHDPSDMTKLESRSQNCEKKLLA